MGEIRILSFKEADLDRIMEIENVSFASPWTRQCYLDLSPLETISFFVVKDGEELVGYMLYQVWEEEMELHTIAVDPERRRQGIARKMIAFMKEDATARAVERIFLQVRPSNEAARSLYQSFGFNVIGVRRGYYRDNLEDAFVMRLDMA
jgi:ribosomal-protein-alanine N-acetyltransferase